MALGMFVYSAIGRSSGVSFRRFPSSRAEFVSTSTIEISGVLQLVWRATPVLSKRDLKQLDLYKQYLEGILKIRDGESPRAHGNSTTFAWKTALL